MRAANYKLAGWVDVVFDVVVKIQSMLFTYVPEITGDITLSTDNCVKNAFLIIETQIVRLIWMMSMGV